MSQNLITFVIPVRHYLNAKNWEQIRSNLSQTIKSIQNQTSDSWDCVIVANRGSDLPELPEKFEAIWVDFPPNPFYEKDKHDLTKVHDYVRLDKGRRILTGMKARQNSEYLMIVDDDDFLNSSLVEYVEKNRGENGWYINKGYVWPENTNLLYKCYFFDQLCGTSLIVKNELYETASICINNDLEIIKERFGSHIMVKSWLKSLNRSLQPLPIFGAIYRIGNINAHSQSKGIFNMFMLPHLRKREFWQFFLSLLNVKRCTQKVKSDFSIF
ncbi:hypothetical protein BM527_13205 [Alteromonas sp. Mex14]|nr:hypothetical protein BM527_13205 [Alteromonas sp. Mex14]